MNPKAIETTRNVFTACALFGLVFFALVGLLTAVRAYTAVIYVCAIGTAWCASWLVSEGVRHRRMRAGRINKVGWEDN